MSALTPNHHVSPTVGDDVATMDGHKLGRIQEVRGEYFRVRKGPFGHGYWLDGSLSYESETGGDEIVVAILNAQVSAHKMTDDAVNAAFAPKHDGILSEAELREQRERMERSLHI